MKVFISWSGKLSHEVACTLRDWLPCVLQSVKPWVSSEDIEKGTRWSTDIAKELKDTMYGIFCITRENLGAPWVNFEAGAISKLIDEANVSPFLIDIIKSDVQGPLAQFQLTIVEKADVSKLINGINSHAPEGERVVDTQLVNRVFDTFWPQLEASITASVTRFPVKNKAIIHPEEKNATILEELLDLARNQQRLLANPPALLPADYLAHVLERFDMGGSRGDRMNHEIYRILHEEIVKLEKMLGSLCTDHEVLKEPIALLSRIHEYVHDLRMHRSPIRGRKAQRTLEEERIKNHNRKLDQI
jgi:hypothetical protein